MLPRPDIRGAAGNAVPIDIGEPQLGPGTVTFLRTITLIPADPDARFGTPVISASQAPSGIWSLRAATSMVEAMSAPSPTERPSECLRCAGRLSPVPER